VVVFAVSRFASLRAQELFAYLFAWFLLFGGIRPIFELQRRRRRGGGRASGALASDADQLALLTGVPGGTWVFGFAVVAVAALIAGIFLLLPGLGHWFLTRGQRPAAADFDILPACRTLQPHPDLPAPRSADCSRPCPREPSRRPKSPRSTSTGSSG